MVKTKTLEIDLEPSESSFSFIKKTKISKEDFDFSGIMAIRQLLSNEKARILHVIKEQKPKSIYELAKKLNRPFKSVIDDIKLLERFGFIEIEKEQINKKIRHKPLIVVDTITLNFKI